MRHVIGLLVLSAGCASPETYRPGPPITVAEPNYSGPVVTAPRSSSGGMVAGAPNSMQPRAAQPPCEPIMAPPRPTFMSWLRSGRGWAWGKASRGPIRDEGLDRLMVDTLTSSQPQASREPLPPAPATPDAGELWIFPPSDR